MRASKGRKRGNGLSILSKVQILAIAIIVLGILAFRDFNFTKRFIIENVRTDMLKSGKTVLLPYLFRASLLGIGIVILIILLM